MPDNRKASLKTLKDRIARVEGRPLANAPALEDPRGKRSNDDSAIFRFGVKELDAAFPHNGMPLFGLHEIRSESRNAGLATGFLCGLFHHLMERKSGVILWFLEHAASREDGAPYGPGLVAFGLSPERFIFATLSKRTSLLWAAEEALCVKDCTAIVIDQRFCEDGTTKSGLTLSESRRLQLRAEKASIPVFLCATGPPGPPLANATLTRFEVGPAPSVIADRSDSGFDEGLGAPSFDIHLTKNRFGKTARTRLSWNLDHKHFEIVHEKARKPALGEGKDRPSHTRSLVSESFERPDHAA
ncbi:MAG: hypothetical protein AAGE61_01610 [Pseudomonadota bacterium]